MPAIVNEQAILDVYGRWPSFHDAEVLSVTLDRGANSNPSLEVAIHAFEMTSEVDERGYYVLKNHRLVRLTFEYIADLVIEDFNHQNVIFDVNIEELNAGENDDYLYGVTFSTSYGMNGVFRCKQIEVKSVEPYPSSTDST